MIRALRNFLRAGRFALTELAKLTREQRRALKRERKAAHAPPPPALATTAHPSATATRHQPQGQDSDTPFGPMLQAGKEIAAEYEKLEQEMQLDVAAQQRRAQQSLTGEPARPEPIPTAPPPPPAKEYTLAAVPPSSTVRSGSRRLAATLAGAPLDPPSSPPAPAAELAPDAPAGGGDLAAELDALEKDAAGDVAALAARQAQEAEAARTPPAALL